MAEVRSRAMLEMESDSEVRVCPGVDCEEGEVRPIALPFIVTDRPTDHTFDDVDPGEQDGFFVVCPSCHYVFERRSKDAYVP